MGWDIFENPKHQYTVYNQKILLDKRSYNNTLKALMKEYLIS